MSDVTLTPQTVALVGTLLTALVTALTAVCGAVVFLYRQDTKGWHRTLETYDRLLSERDRVIAEKEARWVDALRDIEDREIRITTLEAANERLGRLASDATDGWKSSVLAERARLP